MAELSRTHAARADQDNGHDPAIGVADGAPFGRRAASVDPRAVRVRLAAVSQPADEPVVRVVGGEPTGASIRATGRGRYVLDEAGQRSRVVLEAVRPGEAGVIAREVLVDGFRFEVELESERIAALRERAGRGRAASGHSGPLEVRAIIPGKVVAVYVAPGDTVTAGQHLLVVEAMKMQNELRAPRDGTIERVGVAPGVNIEVGDRLVVIG